MPKKAIRIPAARTGRGVRWTLQVSAAPGEGTERAQKPAAKRTTAKRGWKPSRKTVERDQPAQAVSAPAKRASSPRGKEAPIGKTAPAAAAGVRSAPAAVAALPASPAPVSATPAAAVVSAQPRASLSGGRRVAAIAVGVVLVMGILSLMRDPSRRVSSTVGAQPATLAEADRIAEAEPEVAPPARVTRALAPSSPDATASAVATIRTPPATAVEHTNRAVVVPVPPPAPVIATPAPSTPATGVPVAGESLARAGAPESTTAALTPKPNATADLVSQSPVTITGCLEETSDRDGFRLTDTEGAAAPKARGWRSGFIKKQNAAVELVDLREPVALRRLVGRRVVATGLLDSRELRVRSVASAGSTCD